MVDITSAEKESLCSCCNSDEEVGMIKGSCSAVCCALPREQEHGEDTIQKVHSSVEPCLVVQDRNESCVGSCCQTASILIGQDPEFTSKCENSNNSQGSCIPEIAAPGPKVPQSDTGMKGACSAECCSSTCERDSVKLEDGQSTCGESCCDKENWSMPKVVQGACSAGCCEPVALSVKQNTEPACMKDRCDRDIRGSVDQCCDNKDDAESRIREPCIRDCCTGNPKAAEVNINPLNEPMGDCCDTKMTNTGACACCVEDIIRLAFNVYLDSDTLSVNLQKQSNRIRQCCAALQKCCNRACCFLDSPISAITLGLSRSPKTLRACEISSKEDIITDQPILQDKRSAKLGMTLLKLEIRGMDCADCAPKVVRALSHLPSVTAIETDYFSGIAQLRFDPETITSSAISAYLMRATGFRVKAVTGAGIHSSSHIRLPVLFDQKPSPEILAKYDLSHGSGKQWTLSIRVSGGNALRPREAFDGIKLYGGHLADDVEQDRDPASHDLRDLIQRTTLCVLFTVPVLVLAWAPLHPALILYGGIQVGFSTVVQLLASPMYSASTRSIIFIHQIDMNVLAAISMLVSYVFSLVAYAFEVARKPFSSPFFETCTLLVTLIYFGRTVQAATRKSAGSAIRALHQLQTKEVRILESGSARMIDSRLLHYGDVLEIPPSTRIVTDGVIISGSSDVDESSVTGENIPVSKISGNLVRAGTMNLTGTLHIQVTRLLHENSIFKITQLIRHAQNSRIPLQDLADKLSAMVLPFAVTIAGLSLMVWVLVDIFARNATHVDSVIDGLMKAVAVLVVSCPCAIGLAVPIVTAVAIQVLTRSGILVRSADILHIGHRISLVAFDKTGTLSQGHFTIEKSEVFVKGAERVVYGLVKDNHHPIAQGVYDFLKTTLSYDHETESIGLRDIRILPGKGVSAMLDGFEVMGGNAAFTGTAYHAAVLAYLSSGLSIFTVTVGGTCIAVYGLSDLPRPEAPSLVNALFKMGKKVIILSGDNEAAVSQFSSKIGVGHLDTHHSCTPEDKQSHIAFWRSKGETVLFVGDGTNDGPALATADASLAVASGSEVAHTSASAVLLHPNIHDGIMLLLRVSRTADWRMKLALSWCVVYMVAAVVLASGLAVNFSIAPRWAGLGEVISVLPVVFIGLSMR